MASYLQARQQGGRWYLRIDDIDPPRQQAGSCNAIIKSLATHGFHWDGEVQLQSQLSQAFAAALTELAKKGLTYHCICSRKQIAALQKRSESAAINPGLYPGTCRYKQHSATHAKSGAAVRFKVQGKIKLKDKIQGWVSQNLETEVGDFIIKRRDGLYSYQLANVVDDALNNITEIVRGADLLDNTPRQLALIQALGYPTPNYAHIPIAVNSDGSKLSKQTHAKALDDHTAIDNLQRAWRFLGQSTNGLVTQLAGHKLICESTEDFWCRAVRDWDIRRVPRELTCPLPA